MQFGIDFWGKNLGTPYSKLLPSARQTLKQVFRFYGHATWNLIFIPNLIKTKHNENISFLLKQSSNWGTPTKIANTKSNARHKHSLFKIGNCSFSKLHSPKREPLCECCSCERYAIWGREDRGHGGTTVNYYKLYQGCSQH